MPKKVTASIDIPASYYVEIWKKRNPQPADKPAKPPEAAELATIETETKKRIQETVRNLLPDCRQRHESLSAHRRRNLHRSAEGAAAPPTLASDAATWLADNWQTLAIVGVGLVSLLMLRSMVRSSGGTRGRQPALSPASAVGSKPRLAIHEPGDDETNPSQSER